MRSESARDRTVLPRDCDDDAPEVVLFLPLVSFLVAFDAVAFVDFAMS